MSRVLLSALTLTLLLPAVASADDKVDAANLLRGSWVCLEQSGKKPNREVKLVVDKAGGYKMGGTGAESSDLATLGGIDGTIRINKAKGEIDLVGSKLTLPGIYKLEGDRLVLLLGSTGARPTSFEKLDGTFHVFVKETEKK